MASVAKFVTVQPKKKMFVAVQQTMLAGPLSPPPSPGGSSSSEKEWNSHNIESRPGVGNFRHPWRRTKEKHSPDDVPSKICKIQIPQVVRKS